MQNDFWLIAWMQSKAIGVENDIDRALARPEALNELTELAYAAEALPSEMPRTTRPVLGGRGLDLSGEMIGADVDDLLVEVDRVFGTLWHYFDEIVVEGFTSRRYLMMIRDSNYDLAAHRVNAHCKLLLHLARIGALEHITFRQKPNPCVHHGQHGQILQNAGLDAILAESPTLRKQFKGGELLDWQYHGDHFHYRYVHPLIDLQEGVIWDHADDFPDPDEWSDSDVIDLIARDQFELYAEYVAADLSAAEEVGAPLALSPALRDTVVDRLLPRPVVGGAESEVTIEVGLPVLNGIDAATVIKFRDDNAESFERFRVGLRKAVREQLKLSADAEKLPKKVAQELVGDYINPGLADIAQRMQVAKSTLGRKSVTNISVGSVSVVIGLVAAVPILLPAGVALGLAAPGVHYAKYADERSAIELSDLYFLWNARRIRR